MSHSSLDLMSEEALRDPAFVIQQLYAGERVPYYANFSPPFFIVHRYPDVVRVLRDTDVFLSGHGQGPSYIPAAGIVSDPPDHTFYRALVQDLFQPAAIAALQPRLEVIAEQLLADIPDPSSWDLHDNLAFPLPILIICEILGIPADDIWTFKRWSDASVAALAAEDPTPYIPMRDAMATYVLDLVEARRRDPDSSLISRIANAQRDGRPVPNDEALSLITQMFVAGNETTTSLITNFVWRISRLGLWRDFVADRFDLDLAINESLRFDPPLLALFRTTGCETEIGGRTLPENAKVMVHYAAANRDPDVFPDPDTFLPDRRGARHLAFAQGIHACLGRELAKLEARVALTALRAAFPDLRVLDDGARIAPFLFWGRSKLPVAGQ